MLPVNGRRLGMVVPINRPSAVSEVLRFFPDGIDVKPVYMDIQMGTRDELLGLMPAYEERIRDVVGQGVDLVHVGGAPPFLLQGYAEARRIVEGWERRFGVPVYTAPMADEEALRALGISRIVGVASVADDVLPAYERYYRDAGFDCLGFVGLEKPFNRMDEFKPDELTAFARETMAAYPTAEAIYFVGAWRAHTILDPLEHEFGITAILSVVVNGWYVRKRFRLGAPVPGLGRLLRELPDPTPQTA